MPWPQKKARKKPDPLTEAALYDYAVAALGRRMRTVAELRRLMRAKVEPDELGERKIEAVMIRLKEYRYIDDAAFASLYTRLRQENEGFGKLRVQRELARKGIARDLIQHTLDQAYQGTSEEEAARNYIARKRIAKPQEQKEIARVMRRLSVAGFSLSTISQVLKAWKIEFREEDLAASDEGDIEDSFDRGTE